MYFVYSCTVLRANIQNRKTSGFAYGPASRMYFLARAEGRISYGHLGRTNSCLPSVWLFIGLSVCNFTYNHWSDLRENFTGDVALYMEVATKFWGEKRKKNRDSNLTPAGESAHAPNATHMMGTARHSTEQYTELHATGGSLIQRPSRRFAVSECWLYPSDFTSYLRQWKEM